jgi:hypothetical protein
MQTPNASELIYGLRLLTLEPSSVDRGTTRFPGDTHVSAILSRVEWRLV